MGTDVKHDRTDAAEAEEAAGGEDQSLGAAEEKGGFNAKKIVLFVILPLLILGAGGTGAYFLGYLDGILPGKGPECATVKEGDDDYAACLEQLAQSATAPGVFIDVPDMIVNLNASARQRAFLKISLKVELGRAEDQKKFETVLPRVVDQFQTYLRELRLDDLRGSSGLYRMKIELLNRVRAATPEIEVRDVLFQEILIQ